MTMNVLTTNIMHTKIFLKLEIQNSKQEGKGTRPVLEMVLKNSESLRQFKAHKKHFSLHSTTSRHSLNHTESAGSTKEKSWQ